MTQNETPTWKVLQESKVSEFASPATLKYLTTFAEENRDKSIEGWFDHCLFLGTKAAERSKEYAETAKRNKEIAASLARFQTLVAASPEIASDPSKLMGALTECGLTPADLLAKGKKA
jgi:hypothetical protein